jgi:hypothetical protein
MSLLEACALHIGEYSEMGTMSAVPAGIQTTSCLHKIMAQCKNTTKRGGENLSLLDNTYLRLAVVTALNMIVITICMRIVVFRFVTPCSLVGGY